MRLLSNTALLDPSFGTGGLALLNEPGGLDVVGSRAIAAASGGKVLNLFDVSDGTNNGIGIARFKSDGTLDTSFGHCRIDDQTL